ncbi:MAG: DNA polymerase III subunit beta, partial [Atribacterota bacterium]
MEITVLQKNLKRGINNIQNIIGKNLTLPILNNILLKIENKQLKLVATNLEIAILHWTPCKVKKEGEITVPAKLFSDLVNNLPDKKIEIKSNKNNSLQVKCENFKSSIKGVEAKEFPIVPKIKAKPILKIKASKLNQALSQVINFSSISDIRPEISGMLIDIDSKQIKFVTTDSFRLGEKTILVGKNKKEVSLVSDKKTKLKKSIIIPSRTIQELMRILSEEEEVMAEMSIEQNQVLFRTPNSQIISRLIEGSYPNYKQLISDKFETSLTLDTDKFLNAVKVTSLFSSKINDVRLKVIPKKSLIKIHAQDMETGENISELKSEIKGKEVEIIFNHKYLLDGLNGINSSKLSLGLNGETNPGILKPADDSNFIYVI